MKLDMKVKVYNGHKLTKPDFPRKILFGRKFTQTSHNKSDFTKYKSDFVHFWSESEKQP